MIHCVSICCSMLISIKQIIVLFLFLLYYRNEILTRKNKTSQNIFKIKYLDALQQFKLREIVAVVFFFLLSEICPRHVNQVLSPSNVTKDVSFQQLNKSMWINLLRNKLDPNQKNYIHKFESDNSVIQQNKSNFNHSKHAIKNYIFILIHRGLVKSNYCGYIYNSRSCSIPVNIILKNRFQVMFCS